MITLTFPLHLALATVDNSNFSLRIVRSESQNSVCLSGNGLRVYAKGYDPEANVMSASERMRSWAPLGNSTVLFSADVPVVNPATMGEGVLKVDILETNPLRVSGAVM